MPEMVVTESLQQHLLRTGNHAARISLKIGAERGLTGMVILDLGLVETRT